MITDILNIISRLKFKDFSFHLISIDQTSNTAKVQLISETVDTNGNDILIKVSLEHHIRLSNEKDVVLQLYKMVEERVIHECQELFKLDARAIFDPHRFTGFDSPALLDEMLNKQIMKKE